MDHFSSGKAVVKQLVDKGFIAYFAGGWVRDLLLQHPSDDIDIATSASVQQIQTIFPHTIPVGVAFGIVIVVHQGHHFEVATFRQDSGYLDGRRPTQVIASSPEEDAKRRDFTINGMFWDPLQDKLYDFVGGKVDLEARVIRAIGNPAERFLEDRLRMMRAIRYATRFGFTIEEETTLAIRRYASTLLPAVAMERIWQEFKKMSQFEHFDRGLIALHEVGLLPVIFPSLKKVSTEEVVHRVKAIGRLPTTVPTISELIELFPDIDLPALVELCEYLKISSEEKEIALFLHESRQLFSMPSDWLLKMEDYEWVKWYANPYSELALHGAAARLSVGEEGSFLSYHEKKKKELAFWLERMQKKQPLVRAEHLMQEGISPGKKMGLLLQEAEKIGVNQRLKETSLIIAVLKKSSLWNT